MRPRARPGGRIIRELGATEGDAEPSLGSLGGVSDDREEQCEGEGEPEFEGCCWPDEGDQRDLGRGW